MLDARDAGQYFFSSRVGGVVLWVYGWVFFVFNGLILGIFYTLRSFVVGSIAVKISAVLVSTLTTMVSLLLLYCVSTGA